MFSLPKDLFDPRQHRVGPPRSHELTYERLSIVQFSSSLGDFRMAPAHASPLIQREGCVEDQGIAEATDPTDTVRNSIGQDQVMVEGKLSQKREYLGVKVLLPV
ncbi:hypothetical protein IAU59_004669 [Kwoniella sp. CBS 9459]